SRKRSTRPRNIRARNGRYSGSIGISTLYRRRGRGASSSSETGVVGRSLSGGACGEAGAADVAARGPTWTIVARPPSRTAEYSPRLVRVGVLLGPPPPQ